MRRMVLLVVTILFVAGLAVLTVYDVAHNGITPLDVVALVIMLFLGIAIVGALTSRQPPD